jgi:hypothetical protein
MQEGELKENRPPSAYGNLGKELGKGYPNLKFKEQVLMFLRGNATVHLLEILKGRYVVKVMLRNMKN